MAIYIAAAKIRSDKTKKTYRPGEALGDEFPPAVLAQWLARGIVSKDSPEAAADKPPTKKRRAGNG